MKNKIYHSFILLPFFAFLFFSCEPRNIVEVEEPKIPQGEMLFSPHWSEGENIDGNTVTALSPSLNSYTLAATSSGNMLRQKNAGYNWMIFDTVTSPISVLHRSSELIYGASQWGHLYISNTNGRLWKLIRHFNTEINTMITAADNSLLIGTFSGLYRSTDFGENAEIISNGISPNLKVYSLLILKDGSILAGSVEGLYKSNDNGISWTQTGFHEICHILSDNYNSDIFAGTSNGVYRSNDLGNTWTLAGLNDQRIVSLAVTFQKHIFAATTSKGIYYSNNNGYSWRNFGLDDKQINHLLEIPQSDMIIASSGNMIYRLTVIK